MRGHISFHLAWPDRGSIYICIYIYIYMWPCLCMGVISLQIQMCCGCASTLASRANPVHARNPLVNPPQCGHGKCCNRVVTQLCAMCARHSTLFNTVQRWSHTAQHTITACNNSSSSGTSRNRDSSGTSGPRDKWAAGELKSSSGRQLSVERCPLTRLQRFNGFAYECKLEISE